ATTLDATGKNGVNLHTKITNLSAQSTASPIDITNDGDLTVVNVDAGTSTVKLTTNNGQITDGGATSVTATTLDATGKNGVNLHTKITNLSASTTNAAIDIVNIGDINVVSVDAGNSTATLSTAGKITDGGATSIKAGTLNASAGTDIDLHTKIGTLIASATAGKIVIREEDELSLNNVI